MAPIETYRHMKFVIETATAHATTWNIAKQNMYLNDTLDMLIKYELNPCILREEVSQKQGDLFIKWLENLVCKLHKKS